MSTGQQERFVVIGGEVRFTEAAAVPGLIDQEAIICDYLDNGSLHDDLAVLYVRTGTMKGKLVPMHWGGIRYLGDSPSLTPPFVLNEEDPRLAEDGRVSAQPVAHPISVCNQTHPCCVCGKPALEPGHWTRCTPAGAVASACPDGFKVRCHDCCKQSRVPAGEKWLGPGLVGLSEQEIAELVAVPTVTADGRQIFYDVQ